MFNHRYAEISIPWSMLTQTRALIREKVQRSLGSSLDIIGILFLFGSDEKRREREWLRSIHSGCVSFIYHFSYVLHYYILTYNLLEKLYQNYYLDTYHTYSCNVDFCKKKKIESKKLFILCILQYVTPKHQKNLKQSKIEIFHMVEQT